MDMQASVPDPTPVSRFAGAILELSHRHWRLLLVAMLLLLHIAVLRGVADSWARGLLLAHFGLLLLWQPFLRGQQNVTGKQAVFIAVFAAAVTLGLSWWLLAFWVLVLGGLIGGKVYRQHAPWRRRQYLALLGYLLVLLVVVILPEIAPGDGIAPEVRLAAQYGLPVLFVAAAFFPVEVASEEPAEIIDLFYSVFLMLLLGVLILGSFTFMTLGRTSYLQAMTYTLFSVAGTMLVIGLTWSSRAGFAGVNVFFTRYLLSIGLPVEQWLFFLSELSRREPRPERFLADAVGRLLRLPWIAGAEWRTAGEEGLSGERRENSVRYERAELALTIHSRFRISPALHWHLQLLAQLLGEFYVAKLREQTLLQQNYLRAVHETGARVTHDIKNLLQSLKVLCAVAAREDAYDSAQAQVLVRTQLPLLEQRLSAMLERLQFPADASDATEPIEAWWRRLLGQHGRSGVRFAADGLRAGIEIPRVLFDSVADNLLQNALAKRVLDRAVDVDVELRCDGAGAVTLQVCDTGAPVPLDIVRLVLRAPVRSDRGLGIGLYQAARQAEAAGYALRLESNREGEVRFALHNAQNSVQEERQA